MVENHRLATTLTRPSTTLSCLPGREDRFFTFALVAELPNISTVAAVVWALLTTALCPQIPELDMHLANLQPTLRGSLVQLRPLHATDWHALFAVASDPQIWVQHPESDRYTEPVFREFFRIALESRGALLATDAASGAVVGSSRYYGYDEVQREVEIGWTFLARSHWGGQYNGEMKSLMLAHAFQFVDSVIFVIGAQNIRSQRAVQQIGAVFDGTRVTSGKESVVYRIRKPLSSPAR